MTYFISQAMLLITLGFLIILFKKHSFKPGLITAVTLFIIVIVLIIPYLLMFWGYYIDPTHQNQFAAGMVEFGKLLQF